MTTQPQDQAAGQEFDAGVTLLPCPFCGGEARLYSVSFPLAADCADIHVSCVECDAIGPTVLFDWDHHGESDVPDLETEAIAAWNTRLAHSQPASEALEDIASRKPYPELDDGDPGHRCAHCAYRWKDSEGERHANHCAYVRARAAFHPLTELQSLGQEGEDWRDAEIERQEGLAKIYRQAQLTAEEKLCRAEASEKGWKGRAEYLERQLKAAQAAGGITTCPSTSEGHSATSTSTDARPADTKAGPDITPAQAEPVARPGLDLAQLLADVELHFKTDRVFWTSREKIHPCGVDMLDELHARVSAALGIVAAHPPAPLQDREAVVERMARAIYDDRPHTAMSQALAEATGLPLHTSIPYETAIAAGYDNSPLKHWLSVALDAALPMLGRGER